MTLTQLAVLMYLVQVSHSLEELANGFHKTWYLFKMPFWVFLTFEIFFNLFWGIVIFSNLFPNKDMLLSIWVTLMMLNGLQHIIWGTKVRRYVPGLYTAPLHVCLITIYWLGKYIN